MPFIAIILFGILASCFALALELLAAGLFSVSLAALATLSFEALLLLSGIAFIEEASKYLFLRQYAARFFAAAADKSALRRALLLGAGFGIGFAAPEILLIQKSVAAPPALALIGTAGLHIATSAVFAVAILSFAQKRFSAPLLISAAALLHTLYNLGILFFS